MNSIDLSPLYRSTIGYDGIASILNSNGGEAHHNNYPPYNIETLGDDKYTITLAVAGFEKDELEIQIERGVLSIHGAKKDQPSKNFLHQGIAFRSFVRKFSLADYVEVTDADLSNGLLTINLRKEVPESMKAKTIAIKSGGQYIEHDREESRPDLKSA